MIEQELVNELLKQLGVFAFAIIALFALWRFGKFMMVRFIEILERQLAEGREDALKESDRCHEAFRQQALMFADALDKRDKQNAVIVEHLQEQTSTMKTIADQTGKIAIKVQADSA